MLLEELFFEVGIILVIAAALSFVAHRLRQPLIIAYIVAGILVGPSAFALARNGDVFEVMSQIGVAFLLFTVGLGLNWRSVKDIGGIAFAVGVGQVLFTSVGGYLVGMLLGFDALTSAYLAVAISLSSTIVIIKLLTDKEELDTLYGRISIGFLLVKDLIAMFILLGLHAFGRGASIQEVVLETVLKMFIAIPVLWFISAKIVPRIVSYAARSQELLFVFAVAWCFLVAGTLTMAGFGIELGALIAGVMLSGTVYEREITSRIKPLRDFFLIVFFIVLGTNLTFDSIGQNIWPIILFSLFILIGNPFIVMLILRSLGYHPRTGFLSGTTVAQISEFSFIILAAGISIGHLHADIMSTAAMVGLITIAGSAYLIEFNDALYERFAWMFRWLEPAKTAVVRFSQARKPKVIMFGFHRVGVPILHSIRRMRLPYAIVDFDPQVILELSEAGEPALYGDAGDGDFLKEMEAEKARFLISTIPDMAISTSILQYLRHRNFRGTAIVSAKTAREAEALYKAGATYVIVPNILGGKKFQEHLEEMKMRQAAWKKFAVRERELLSEIL